MQKVSRPAPVMVVTGTSRGIGRGIAEFFAKKEFQVVGCSRGPATLTHPCYSHDTVDLTQENQVRDWISSTRRRYGTIDILVASQGLVQSVLLMPVTSGKFLEEMFRINTFATYYLCREVSKIMLLNRRGHILTFSSIMVGLNEPGTSAYTASKAAVEAMTKVLANELAGQGISCNCIAPGMVLTEPVLRMGEDWRRRMLDRQTVKRPLEISEICQVIDQVISSSTQMITGQVIRMGLSG